MEAKAEVEAYFSGKPDLLIDFLIWRSTEGFMAGRLHPEWYDDVWKIVYKYSDDDGGTCNLMIAQIRALMLK
jgi:hypothetical protein